jgi:hypothetical protein
VIISQFKFEFIISGSIDKTKRELSLFNKWKI